MKDLSIKGIPDDLYMKLRLLCIGRGVSVKSFVVALIERSFYEAEKREAITPPPEGQVVSFGDMAGRIAGLAGRSKKRKEEEMAKPRIKIPEAVNTVEAVEEKLAEVIEKKGKREYTGEKVFKMGHWSYEIIVDGRKTWTFDEEE